jgi:hypothetical protein
MTGTCPENRIELAVVLCLLVSGAGAECVGATGESIEHAVTARSVQANAAWRIGDL